MWINNQPTQTVFYVGAALGNLVTVLSMIGYYAPSSIKVEKVITVVVIWAIVVTVLSMLINYLVNNNKSELAWVVAVLPLVSIPMLVKSVCLVCKLQLFTQLAY